MNLGKLKPSKMNLGKLEPSRKNCCKLERSRMNLIVPFFGSGVAWSLCFIKIGAHATERETQFVILRKVV